MKIGTLDEKIKQKTEEVNKLTHQLKHLQNTLTSEQFKNSRVTDEIKEMHLKNIKV